MNEEKETKKSPNYLLWCGGGCLLIILFPLIAVVGMTGLLLVLYAIPLLVGLLVAYIINWHTKLVNKKTVAIVVLVVAVLINVVWAGLIVSSGGGDENTILEQDMIVQEKDDSLPVDISKEIDLTKQAELEEQRKIEEEQKRIDEEKKARQDMIEIQFSVWDGSHRKLTEIIKDSMNDPKSYEHVETGYWDMDDHLIVVTSFRGKNAFGGVVMNTVKAKISLDGEDIEILEQY